MKTLEEVVKLYSKGGEPNPYLDRKIDRARSSYWQTKVAAPGIRSYFRQS